MNEMGYDVAIPGNHEFDYGMDNFLEIAENASFPYICCNLLKDGEPVLDPYVIKEAEASGTHNGSPVTTVICWRIE